ncbi:MAG: hypothetical protein LUF78_03255 [Clostridiales bacterium]|nr:hypothetical protein [Clostridiales bacterium]MCD8153701.1 hypothetical protein [Clostridiales bacterium]
MLETIMNLQVLLYAMTVVGAAGAVSMLATNLTYRRSIRSTDRFSSLKEKWLTLWKTRDRLLHRMNRLVWYPALLSTALLGLALFLSTYLDMEEGISLGYLYAGAAVPVCLLLLRQALDFSWQEELVMRSLADYVEQTRRWATQLPKAKKEDPVLQEEVVDKITSSIRQTAASGSHFSKMLSPEEEEIMRDIIREFMNA